MTTEPPINTPEFLASFKGFMDQVVRQAPAPEEPLFLRRLRDHFGGDPAALPVLSESFKRADHPNLHLALTGYVEAAGRNHGLFGLTTPNEHVGIKLGELTDPNAPEWRRPSEAPVEYVNLPLHDDAMLACVKSGLYLIAEGEARLAVLLRGPSHASWPPQALSLDVMAPDRSAAEAFLAAIRLAIRRTNVYRGHVISLEENEQREVTVRFHRLPGIGRGGIILPAGVLERIERQTVGFARLGERLKAAGRHLKRGLLLYGPPGTGKTLTAMYLAGQMPERTIILLTGRGLGLVEQSCQLARLLQPATVILEDVDLIAEERTRQNTGTNALLFELLNQMDGLADDADVLFLLTTNRPDILEPALAARPGRIDLALEVPLPDAACRERLLDLYAEGLAVRLDDRASLVAQTEGVSAAFMRELMRKAAVFAADEGPELVVEDRHLREALHELVVEGGELTRRLLGAATAPPAERRDGC